MFHKNNQSAVYSNSSILHRKQLYLSTETFIWMNFVNILTGILQNTKTHLIFEPNAIYLAGHDEDQLRVAQFKIEYIAFQEFKMIYVMKDQRTIYSYKPYTSIFYSKNYKDLYSKYRGTCLFVKDKLIKEQKQLQDQTGYQKDFDFEKYESFVIAWVPKKKEQKISKLFQTWIAEYNQSNTFTPKLELRPTMNKEYFNDADPLQQIAMTYIDFILFYSENDVEQFQLQNKILIKLVDDGRKIQFKIYSSNLLYCQQAQQNINDFLNQQSLEIFNMELFDLCEDFDKFLFDLEGILKKKCNLPVRLYKLDSILSLVKEIDRKFDTQIQNYVYSLRFKQCLFYSKQRENTQASKVIKDIVELRLKFNQIMKKKQLEMSYLSQSFQSNKSSLLNTQQCKSSILPQIIKDKEQLIPQEYREQSIHPDSTSKYQYDKNSSSFSFEQKSRVTKENIQQIQKGTMNDQFQKKSDYSNGGTYNSMESLKKNQNSFDSIDNSDTNELQEFCNDLNLKSQVQNKKNKIFEEEKVSQMISIHHISHQFVRQILQIGFDQNSIVYKLKDQMVLHLKDWEQSLRDFLINQDIQINDLEFIVADDQITINTKLNYQYVSAICDQFFSGTTCFVVRLNQNSLDFRDELKDSYEIESKQTQYQQIGLITKKQYEQLQVDEKGKYLAMEIQNYMYFEKNIQQRINQFINKTELDEPQPISELGKMIIVLSQSQLNYLEENYQEPLCNRLIKFGKYLSNAFYFVEIENNKKQFYEEAQDQLKKIGYEMVEDYCNRKKQKYKNQQIIQLKQNSWKLCIYSNINKFYTKLINDLLEIKLNEKEYLQIFQGGLKLSELQIDLGKFQVKHEKDIGILEQILLGEQNCNYYNLIDQDKCASQKIDQFTPGNYLTIVVRSDQLPIENTNHLQPDTTLIRGYYEVQGNHIKQQQQNC
ncbi:unnamed protein product (macronuclear) [Paramecium tetraurelia]|uniref:Uncharacterized protein n=1 Tax=Paramecium tetraurelia TaxID=5888 RepID=A0BDF1_PARTE|nr:uncharacterized protein GSPATT00027596001 [Paramecium tetraurelia]CAK56568.1 unnamed protein product [Paramecium tetraurelia]|eukprot:XP_001423966.1 hypothetical protein (macronuclear) [Paramecium tetraurelia strain d4-2]